jgi:adenylate cyclase
VFTSKEVLERTGISRATLNNYISSGLLPRPDVLPPDPSDGSAPRIGYFPDDTVDRILEIQRLKADGWSIGRIARHFEQGARGESTEPAGAASGSEAGAIAEPTGDSTEFFEEIEHPSYGVGAAFELLWCNEAAQGGVVGRLLDWPSGQLKGRGILDLLLQGGRDPGSDDLIGFHLAVARQRSTPLADLCRGLAPEQAAGIARRLQDIRPPVPGSVAIARLPVPGLARGLAVHALQLRAGVVFLYAPPAHDETPARPAPVEMAAPSMAGAGKGATGARRGARDPAAGCGSLVAPAAGTGIPRTDGGPARDDRPGDRRARRPHQHRAARRLRRGVRRLADGSHLQRCVGAGKPCAKRCAP